MHLEIRKALALERLEEETVSISGCQRLRWDGGSAGNATETVHFRQRLMRHAVSVHGLKRRGRYLVCPTRGHGSAGPTYGHWHYGVHLWFPQEGRGRKDSICLKRQDPAGMRSDSL